MLPLFLEDNVEVTQQYILSGAFVRHKRYSAAFQQQRGIKNASLWNKTHYDGWHFLKVPSFAYKCDEETVFMVLGIFWKASADNFIWVSQSSCIWKRFLWQLMEAWCFVAFQEHKSLLGLRLQWRSPVSHKPLLFVFVIRVLNVLEKTGQRLLLFKEELESVFLSVLGG